MPDALPVRPWDARQFLRAERGLCELISRAVSGEMIQGVTVP